MREVFFICQNSYGNTTQLIFFTLKKKSLPFQRQAKQELKIKVAQNLWQGTLQLTASHHKFFFFGIKTLMGIERFEVLSAGRRQGKFTSSANVHQKKKLYLIGRTSAGFFSADVLYSFSYGCRFFFCVDPLPYWLWRRRRQSQKVALIWLKIGQQEAYG